MGIHEKVIRRAKVEYDNINSNSQHDSSNGIGPNEELDVKDGIPCLPKKLAVPKVSGMSSLLGRASTSGFGRAVEAMQTLGSSMAILNTNTGFTSGATTKGTKISILAFEVANTTVKGSNLMQSLSTYNIKHLKEVVLPSEGVQNLVSRNMDQLLRIVAADKREELKTFWGEVAQFGNRCKEPQWHSMNRYFSNFMFTRQKLLKEDAEVVMQQLMMLVSKTHELYHEICSLDKFEQEYRCNKLQEQIENPETCQRGRGETSPCCAFLRQEIQEIHHEAFSNAGTEDEPVNDSPNNHKTLGAHHRYGWVGEWANTGSGMNREPAGQTDLLRIETLHHADKNRTEAYILELVVWLHYLVNQSRVSIGSIQSELSNHSPTSERRKDPFPIRRPSSGPIIDFDFDRSKALDVIDRVDTIRSI